MKQTPLAHHRSIPHAPSLQQKLYRASDREDVFPVEHFTFSLIMLPSINEKHGRGRGGRGTHVDPVYRQKELREVARIAYQRDLVGWPAPSSQDRYALFYQLSYRTKLKQDLHNPLKPICDLLGAGRYEWEWHGRTRTRIWVPHAQVLWNDNRVLYEAQMKEIHPGKKKEEEEEIQWATIHLFRCLTSPYEDFLLRHTLNTLARHLETTVPHFSLV